jgi:hypothetical protein
VYRKRRSFRGGERKEPVVPKVRITEDTLWYGRSYRKGEEVVVEGREYLDLLMAGRVAHECGCEPKQPPVLAPGRIEGRHKGELIFVLGNGPSLALATRYRRELEAITTIGVNRVYKLLSPTYLLFLDRVLWGTDSEEILACGSLVLCPRRLRLPYFTRFGRYHAKSREDVLSERWQDGLYWSRSSSVAALNLACLFGATGIALLGVDLRDRSHFYSGRGRNRPFLHADEILEDLWWMSRKMLEKGIRLWNCSPDSAVRGFEKVELSALLERVHSGKSWR